jgi:lipid A oxidase
LKPGSESVIFRSQLNFHSRSRIVPLRLFQNLHAPVLALCLALFAIPASAEVELSFYTGVQEAPHSRVEGNDPSGVGAFSFLAKWDGKSFEAPPYYGFRATWWTGSKLGFGIDFSHDKVYSDAATRAANGFSTLEFTDGLNILTANVWRRWQFDNSRWTPYVGAGVGVSVPHVESQTTGGPKTFEYQLTGPAVQWVAGVKYDLNDRWGLFGEYKGTYSVNDADLVGGGTLSTDIITNAVNVGVSFKF